MKRIVWISCLCLLGACSRADEPRFESRFDPENPETVDIAYLKSLCRGNAYAVRQSIIIEGRVTGNDLFREFPRRIWVEDRSGGIEIYIDGLRLHERYPAGAPLRIYCEGLYLGDYGGKIILGSQPTAEYVVDRIDPDDFALRAHLLSEDFEPIVPEECTFDDLSAARIGRFVRFSDVGFIDGEAGLRWCDLDPETGRPVATTRTLCDEAGRTLGVFTAAECLYATEPLPNGKGSVCGILDRFNGVFQLRISNRDFDFREAVTDAAPPKAGLSAAGYSGSTPMR